MNLGNFYNTTGQYELSIEYYNEYLARSPGITDAAGRGRALYNRGFACFSLRDYEQAVTCYRESVAMATECHDKVAMARAYCNLGLASKALADFDAASDCQRLFLELSNELKSVRGQFKALGNLGDVCVAQKNYDQAAEYFQKQLELSEHHNDPMFIAQACSSLGLALRHIAQLTSAWELHVRECEIYRNVIKDAKNEYKAQGRCGATLTALGRYSDAISCYERQLEISRSRGDALAQTQAWANLAITHSNLHDYESAVKSFEEQIGALENLQSKSSQVEKCKAYCSIADCCAVLEQHRTAISNYQISLTFACEIRNMSLIERCCAGINSSAQPIEDLKLAATWAEYRLKVCYAIGRSELTAAACGELGYVYSLQENFEGSLQCFNQQMKLAVELNSDSLKSDAACGLGSVHLLMKDFDKALTFHKLDLELAQRNNDRPCQGRAYGNIAGAYEATKQHAAAIASREQHLFIAKEQHDDLAKLVALHGIGR